MQSKKQPVKRKANGKCHEVCHAQAVCDVRFAGLEAASARDSEFQTIATAALSRIEGIVRVLCVDIGRDPDAPDKGIVGLV